jgi:hypothetical protein
LGSIILGNLHGRKRKARHHSAAGFVILLLTELSEPGGVPVDRIKELGNAALDDFVID